MRPQRNKLIRIELSKNWGSPDADHYLSIKLSKQGKNTFRFNSHTVPIEAKFDT